MKGRRGVSIKKAFIFAPIILLMGCQAAQAPSDPAICETLNENFVWNQKVASGRAERYRAALETGDEVLSTELANYPIQFGLDRNANLMQMLHYDCELPQDIDSMTPYSREAAACADEESCTDMADWRRDDEMAQQPEISQ